MGRFVVAAPTEHVNSVPPNDDEPALILAAQADREAFGPLYQRYVGPVYRYLRAHIDSAEEAADITQQVFLRAMDALPRYQARGTPFAAWLFRIAQRAAADVHRRRRTTITRDALPEEVESILEQNPEAIFLRNESLSRLRALLAQLDPPKQELLVLRFAAGLSIAEIAALVGKSPAAIKKQLFRTLQTLKEQYYGTPTD